jgi:NAD(P)-dependent dehydrogenase (short-subunit alcohol dehydrogenase family)
VTTTIIDVSSRASVHALVEAATKLGEVSGVIHAAGVSPSQASPETILKVDLYGTAVVLEEFGNVTTRGGAGVVIASQSGHRLPALSTEQNAMLATTPVEDLLGLPMLQPYQIKDSLHAYQISKRGNSLRVMAEAVRWGKRGLGCLAIACRGFQCLLVEPRWAIAQLALNPIALIEKVNERLRLWVLKSPPAKCAISSVWIERLAANPCLLLHSTQRDR